MGLVMRGLLCGICAPHCEHFAEMGMPFWSHLSSISGPRCCMGRVYFLCPPDLDDKFKNAAAKRADRRPFEEQGLGPREWLPRAMKAAETTKRGTRTPPEPPKVASGWSAWSKTKICQPGRRAKKPSFYAFCNIASPPPRQLGAAILSTGHADSSGSG